MTNQEKIRYLKRYSWLDKEIDRKVEEVIKWRARLGKITMVYSDLPKGGGSIHKGSDTDIINRIVDLEDEINRDIDKLIAIRKEVKAAIETVKDDRERLLLQYRYLDSKTFEWIASEMIYAWRHIHRLHSAALINVVIECHN